MCCLSFSLMSTNVAGFLAFAKRITMWCLSLGLMSTNPAGFLAFCKTYHHVLSIFKSHVYKRSRPSGFCKTYHHALSILRPHVYKGSRTSGFCKNGSQCVGFLDFAKRITIYCLSLSLMSTNVAGFWILQNVSPCVVYR